MGSHSATSSSSKHPSRSSNQNKPHPTPIGNRKSRHQSQLFCSSNTLLLFLSMISFFIGIVAVLTPFWLAIDCSRHQIGNVEGRRSESEPWPLLKLTKFKCGSTGSSKELGRMSSGAVKEGSSQSYTEDSGLGFTGAATSTTAATASQLEDSGINYGNKLKVAASGFCIKKSDSKTPHICGEDAFSVNISPKAPNDGRTFLAVADGVGGWSISGGDSSKISTGLLEEMKNIIGSTDTSLSEAGTVAFSRLAQQSHKSGSTTVCASLIDHKTGKLHISNVGDSGAYVFRGDRLILKTKSGQEAFNAPHQLGFDEFGNVYGSFSLMESTYNVALKPGDIIVLATDGVLDNLYDEELREIVVAMLESAISKTLKNTRINPATEASLALQERVKSTATSLAWHAWARSQETHWLSPFSQAALVHGFPYYGGKQDDITIIIAVITQ